MQRKRGGERAKQWRLRKRKRDGALLWKGCSRSNKLDHKGQRKDNPGTYQDGNKAYPKNF